MHQPRVDSRLIVMTVGTMEEAPVWERFKENAAPLQRGRSVTSLEQSLSYHSEERRLELAQHKHHFEALVRPTEEHHGEDSLRNSDDDPLIHWLSYIKFHQDNFPADTEEQFVLLERCFRSMYRIKRYADDPRFIRVCCLYADKTSRPREVFQYLYQQKIGVRLAIFWAAWAFVVEKEQDFAMAEKIFEKAMQKNAQPLQYIQQRHKQFQRRMSRYWLNASQRHEQESDLLADGTSRGVLGGLSEEAIRRNDRSSRNQQVQRESRQAITSQYSTFADRRGGSQQREAKRAFGNSHSNRPSFAIFEDVAHNDVHDFLDDSVGVATDRQLEREQDLRKENTLNAERWDQRGALSSSYHHKKTSAPLRPPAPFAVFVDEECAQQGEREERQHERYVEHQRRSRDERTFQERAYLGVAERLADDPLMYVRNPAQVEVDQAARKEGNKVLNANEAQKKKSLSCGFKQELLRNGSGEEQCFEEARVAAKSYRVISSESDFTVLQTVAKDDSLMSLEDSIGGSSVEGFSRRSIRPPLPNSSASKRSFGRLRFRADTSLDQMTPRNASTASSTVDEAHCVGANSGKEEPTINTQFALKELSMMFSSPACVGGSNESLDEKDAGGGLASLLNDSGFSEVEEKGFQHGPHLNGRPHSESRTEQAVDDEIENDHARNVVPTLDGDDLLTMHQKSDRGLSVGGSNAKRLLGTIEQYGFSIHEDTVDTTGVDVKEMAEGKGTISSFTIHHVAADNEHVVEGDGDTATFSIFNDAIQVLDALSPAGHSQASSDVTGVLVDQKMKDIRKPCLLATMSRISHVDDDTLTIELPAAASVIYDDAHQEGVKTAQIFVRTNGSDRLQSFRSVAEVLSQERLVFNCSSQVLPRALKSDHLREGETLRIGGMSCFLQKILGRGAYGAVVCIGERNYNHTDNFIAVKAQSPTDCLAWEYQIMEKIHDRLERDSDDLHFPKPYSFISFADGALFSMSAGSSSGMNLVDLANVYTTALGSRPPELIALHYTARMLHHLEKLHWKGKILHCDTKPDNWILTGSTFTGHDVQHSDLMLVDFGRAVDLEGVNPENPHEVTLSGVAATQEMMCVAMREQVPWSFDCDTYGLCASAHVLLFGSHIKIHKEGKLWMPREKFRRQIHRELWTKVFSALLNLDPVTKKAIGSRPHSLRQLRSCIEDCIRPKLDELAAALRYQAKIMPSSRPS